LWTAATLRMQKLPNPQHRWEPHDLNDVKAMSAAAVYCDVVVTEKSWVDLMHRAGVDDRLGTRLLTDINDLLPLV
jgi:hypothetical protein